MQKHHCHTCNKDLTVKEYANHWKLHHTQRTCPLCKTQQESITQHAALAHPHCDKFTRMTLTEDGTYLETPNGAPCGTLRHDAHSQQGGTDLLSLCKDCFQKGKK